jgi:hypothetical protein
MRAELTTPALFLFFGRKTTASPLPAGVFVALQKALSRAGILPSAGMSFATASAGSLALVHAVAMNLAFFGGTCGRRRESVHRQKTGNCRRQN